MEQIQRVKVWGGWLRLSHAAIGLATLVLAATGWLIGASPSVANGASDIHHYAASVLLFGLVVRLALGVFGAPVERLRNLLPQRRERTAVRDTLIFYARLGRAAPPRWYAHNPLWKPVYLLIYGVLLLMLLSGGLQTEYPVMFNFYLPEVHRSLAVLVAWLTGLHVLTVVLHDYRGDAADVSSMINGHRYFPPTGPTDGGDGEFRETAVRLDRIGRG